MNLIKSRKILVVGGGFSGMTAAIELAQAGHGVELVEIDPGWRSYGAGISLHGATLRVLRGLGLGLYDKFLATGATSDGFEIRSPHDDALILSLGTPSIGDGLPGGGGIMRPALAELLRAAVRDSGVTVRLGTTFRAMEDRGDRVAVTFADGGAGEYDLVVGADGLRSAVRQAVFADAPEPRFSFQGVWRAVVPRWEGLARPMMWISGSTKAGINVVSDKQAYMFLMESRETNEYVPDDALLPRLRELLAQFSSPILARIRNGLGPDSSINYRPLEQLLLPRPWHQGRVVLIGDAVHATTPHLAAGACIGVEDAVVLCEELGAHADLDAVLVAYADRRWERCRMVVENSGRLGEIEVEQGDPAEHARIMSTSMAALAQPI